MGWGGCPRCPHRRPCAVQRRFTPEGQKSGGGGGFGVFRRKIHLIARARGAGKCLENGPFIGQNRRKTGWSGRVRPGLVPVVAALPSDLRRCGPACLVSERGSVSTRRPDCPSGRRFTWHECSSGQFGLPRGKRSHQRPAPPAPCGRRQRSDRGHRRDVVGTAHIIGP